MRRYRHLHLILLFCGFGSIINSERCFANDSINLTSVVQTDSTTKDSGKSQEATSAAESPTPEPGMCGVCHLNAVVTWQSSKHFAKMMVCIGCHGESADHIRVEDNSIKPAVYFSQGGTTELKFCQEKCHKKLSQEPHKDLKNCKNCHEAHAFAKP